MSQYSGLLGLLLLPALAWAISEHRRRFPWRLALAGLGLQIALAYLLLSFPPLRAAFEGLARLVNGVIRSGDAGITFLFGNMADASQPWGFIFAFKVLPIIVFFASLMAVLYHIGLMQRIIAALAWLLRRTLRVTGVEAMVMAANVFVGQTEAPLCIRPYMPSLTRAQMMTLMTGGFATIAGSVLAAYVGLLGGDDDAQRVLFAKHLITASVLSAPAAFVMARIIVPETDHPAAEAVHAVPALRSNATNMLDAAAEGASTGLKLALNVGAMLVAFVSLLALVNWPLGAIGAELGHPGLSLQSILGALFSPIAFAMGAPWAEASAVGALLGEKLVATEFVAYVSLAEMKSGAEPVLSARSAQIATYALCGFANFPSIAIQIGGLTALAPTRRSDIVSLAPKAMLAGALASWMTASVASLFL